MKSRDEIMIIMLQWLRLYTLGSRGSRELKTFLETRLISSQVDQKLKNKRGEIHAFKEGIRAEIVAIGSGRGRRLKASWERAFGCGVVASIPRKIRANWASNQPPRRPRFPPRSTTIASRSGFDRASIVLQTLQEMSSELVETNPL